jgi:hypothetical protein
MILVTASLQEGDYSDPVAHSASEGVVAVSITGTFVATLTLQRSLDGGVTWGDDEITYSAPREVSIPSTNGALYRIGIKTGDYTSGTASVRLL